MLEDDLRSAGERVAPPTSPELQTAVLARLDRSSPVRRRVVAVVAVVATALAGLGLSPQVRAAAADLLDLLGVTVTRQEPDASPTPDAVLPGSRQRDLARAAAAAGFPVGVPSALGEPDRIRVADGGRVVTMSWDDGRVVLDQFSGRYGPVFEKQVGAVEPVDVDVDGVGGWWFDGPHDLLYVDRAGEVVSATARLAGPTLLWQRDGVSLRLEGILTRTEALEVAGTVEPRAG